MSPLLFDPVHSADVSPRPVPCQTAHGRARDALRQGSSRSDCALPPADPSPVPSSSSTYHAIIGGIVAFIVFLLLILLIFLGHYLIRHKGQRQWGAGAGRGGGG